jgi:hypothetical protein
MLGSLTDVDADRDSSAEAAAQEGVGGALGKLFPAF